MLQVLGNANALIKSDDWAALIADAKAKKYYVHMDSIPKEFLSNEIPNQLSSTSTRAFRSQSTAGPGHGYSENYTVTSSGRVPSYAAISSYVPLKGIGCRSSYNPSERN